MTNPRRSDVISFRKKPNELRADQKTGNDNFALFFENLLNKKQLAEKLGMSVGFINKWMPFGLPHWKFGSSVRFDWCEVSAWLKRRCHIE